MLFAETELRDVLSAVLTLVVILIGLAGFLFQLKLRRLIFEEQVKRKQMEEAEADRQKARERRLDTRAAVAIAAATDSIKAAGAVAKAEVQAAAPALTEQVRDNSAQLEGMRAELAEHKAACPSNGNGNGDSHN